MQKPNVELVEGDLLDQPVEVIVNAWNRNVIPWWLLLPQGVSGAIKRRGGTGPFKELAKYVPCRWGLRYSRPQDDCRSRESSTWPVLICCGEQPSYRFAVRLKMPWPSSVNSGLVPLRFH